MCLHTVAIPRSNGKMLDAARQIVLQVGVRSAAATAGDSLLAVVPHNVAPEEVKELLTLKEKKNI